MDKTHAENNSHQQRICERAALGDGGIGTRFEIERDGQRIACIAIAFEGAVYAYRNHCPHRGTELDWQPGEVFDETGLYLVCATHGAVFEPASGLCVGGPCHGANLGKIPISVENEAVVLQSDILASPSRPSSAQKRIV